MEVNQKTDAISGKFQVRKDDRFVNGSNLLDGFQFYDDPMLDKNVYSVATFEFYIFIDHGNGFLAFEEDASQGKLAT